MAAYLTESVYFGIFLTILVYEIALAMGKKWKLPILNPILISMIIIMVFLKATNIPYETYEQGARYIGNFLTPLTVCLAVPLYRQIKILKENILAVLVSICAGCLSHALIILVMTRLLGMEEILRNSLMGKSVTTAIALGVCNELGGIQGITVVGLSIAGILGNVFGPAVLKLAGVKNPIAFGLGMGTASHAVGTSKALEIGEIQGAMSSLAIVVAGILTVIMVPVLLEILA